MEATRHSIKRNLKRGKQDRGEGREVKNRERDQKHHTGSPNTKKGGTKRAKKKKPLRFRKNRVKGAGGLGRGNTRGPLKRVGTV